MAISVSNLWKPTPRDLREIAENIKAASAILAMPLLKRRARMVELGYRRHLYKFRDIPDDRGKRQRLEQMLLNNELFAATSDTFNDPFDAQADYRIEQQRDALRELVYRYLRSQGAPDHLARSLVADALLDDSAALTASIKASHQQLLQQLGVCCLSETATDPLLWAHYAQDHCGIAVQYRPSLDPMSLQPHLVHYNAVYPIIENFFDREKRDIFSPLLRKSPSWAYEREWRILRPNAPNRAFQVRPEALTAVLLGMRISDGDREYIRGLVGERNKRYELKTLVFQAEAAVGEYRVRMRRLR
ncbi:DUF2971 domain-containing protein [Rhodanobacter sp. A1T4]|uniref:DUF2971 domain-containing protein n=1 Tax=Rhodanobacter sp. A1T4 TaxID=2723087 RepID=UPI0016120713|nr:DUF2971 domain-containing protein [Rhodanobacter sp. A1T4]MBB6249162.1 hypothetical protein [Rhodanobacter sp. A1T4]